MALKKRTKDGELPIWQYCDVCGENQELEIWVVDEEEGKIGIKGFHIHFGGDEDETVELPALILEFPDHNIASRFKHKMELIARAMREASGEDPEEEED